MPELGTSYQSPKRAVTPAAAEPDTAVEWKAEGQGWEDEPTILDQYFNPRYAGSWMEGPQTVDEFTLNDEGKKQLNALLAMVDPPDAPRAILIAFDKEWNVKAGHYTVFVRYRRVKYKRLVEMPKSKSSTESETAPAS